MWPKECCTTFHPWMVISRKQIMTLTEKLLFKQRLLQTCVDILKERMTNTSGLMENAQRSANSEEKSSAGDKYETSRAMSHLEKDMYAKQLQQTRYELSMLMDTDCSRIHSEAGKGSVIECTETTFFIAAGIGKVEFENQLVIVLSPLAPMGKLLSGKKEGDQVNFNKMLQTIQRVF